MAARCTLALLALADGARGSSDWSQRAHVLLERSPTTAAAEPAQRVPPGAHDYAVTAAAGPDTNILAIRRRAASNGTAPPFDCIINGVPL